MAEAHPPAPREPAPATSVPLRFTQTDSFVALLHELGATLLVTTYQAGQLLALRADGGGLSMLVRTFDKPMGIAVNGRQLALGVGKPGGRTAPLTEGVDVSPTLAELAGLPAPQVPQGLDGRSLVPLLRDPAAAGQEAVYHVYPRSPGGRELLGRAVRTARHRLVEW